MITKFLFVSAFLLLCATHETQHKPLHHCDKVKPFYTYNMLTLIWPTQFCENIQCNQNIIKSHRPMLTIQGFWPSSKQPNTCKTYWELFGDYNCMHKAYKMDCDINRQFNNETQLLNNLAEYWPSYKLNIENEEFYHEAWTKHGTCYLKNIIQLNEEVYGKADDAEKQTYNKTIMLDYFRETINKVKEFNVRLEPGKTYASKAQFAADIGLEGKQTSFYVSCRTDNELDQINICYSRSHRTDQETLTKCPIIKDSCFADRNKKSFSLKIKPE